MSLRNYPICSPVVQLSCAATGSKYLAHGVQDLIEFYATIARHLHFAFLDSVCRIFSLLVVVAFFSFPKIPVGRWETKQTYYGHGQGSIQIYKLTM